MDAVTLALAKAYTNSQRLAYVEGTAPMTFNGDTTNTVDVMGMTAVKLSDEYVDLNNISSIEMKQVVIHDGERTEANSVLKREELEIDGDMGILVVRAISGDLVSETPILLATQEDIPDYGVVKGTYVFVNGGGNVSIYVSRINFPETIHPIDPKFLPGAVLPVVELTTVPTSEGSPLTEAETSAIVEAAKNSTPIVLKFHDSDGAYYGVVCSYLGAGYVYGDGLFSVVAQDAGEGLGWYVGFTMLG